MVGKKKNRCLLALAVAAMICGVMFVFVSSLASVQAATQTSYKYGDANNDGNVDSFDLGVDRNIILAKSLWNPYGDANGDGYIDSFDLGVIRNIILAKGTALQGYEASYDFNTVGAGTDDLAVWKNVPSRPTDTYINESGWANFSGGDHDDVKAVDADSFTVSGQAGNKSVTECRFTVDEAGSLRSCISALGFEVRGNTTMDATMQYWLWKFSSNSWAQVGGNIAIGTTEATYVKWSEDWGKVFANYIDDQGHVYVLIMIDTGDIDQIINYIKLELVTGCQGPTPTPTVSATVSPTVSPTMSPTISPAVSPTPTESITPTATATGEPTSTSQPTATVMPTPTPTAMETVVVTPTPTSVTCEHAYDFINVTRSSGPHDAYYLSVYNMPPPKWRWYLLKTEATDEEYTAISTSDDSRWHTPNPGYSLHALVTFEMVVEEDPASISKIDFVFEGYAQVRSDFEIWAYNFAKGKGERVGSRMDIPAGSDSVMIRSITSHCSDYINDDGKVIWGVYEKEKNHHHDGYWMAIDYVKLVATCACQ